MPEPFKPYRPSITVSVDLPAMSDIDEIVNALYERIGEYQRQHMPDHVAVLHALHAYAVYGAHAMATSPAQPVLRSIVEDPVTKRRPAHVPSITIEGDKNGG